MRLAISKILPAFLAADIHQLKSTTGRKQLGKTGEGKILASRNIFEIPDNGFIFKKNKTTK